jgi:hypothetical protein
VGYNFTTGGVIPSSKIIGTGFCQHVFFSFFGFREILWIIKNFTELLRLEGVSPLPLPLPPLRCPWGRFFTGSFE